MKQCLFLTVVRSALTNYLHDFYIHSFVSAKYWGRGPRNWTAGMVSALTIGSMNAAGPHSPPAALTPAASSGLALPSAPGDRANRFTVPTNLCRWSIHVPNVDYDAVSDDLGALEKTEFDVERPSSWAPWTKEDLASTSLPDMMRESITSSTFTSATVEELPVSVGLISQSVQKDPTALLVDTWRLAIMSGNHDLLEKLVGQENGLIPEEVIQDYPFHLAASYLDGGNTCCLVFRSLLNSRRADLVRRYNINDKGQTILDCLLMSVLRSHTSVSPDHLSIGSSPLNRYPGEEKDICGRWDADSPAVRELFSHGYGRIPTSWKHPFCHTAAQAVCHAVIGHLGSPVSPDINTPSGLFVRRCTSCGLELKPGPIHTLVILSFYLAHNGMAGETLFGTMAVLVCLTRFGASVTTPANISIGEILGTTPSEECHHAPMTPCDLMTEVPGDLVGSWTEDCRVGWDCIFDILRLNERAEANRESSDVDEDSDVWLQSDSTNTEAETCYLDEMGIHDDFSPFICGNPRLGILWAVIQAELLTYRRIEEGAPWISENFSMRSLRAWLVRETKEFGTPLVENKMMKSYSRCGWFCDDHEFYCPVAEEVCVEHFMNMDDYTRTSFLERPVFTRVSDLSL